MKRKKSYIILVIFILIIISAISYIYIKQKPILAHQKCSNEYGTDDAGSKAYLADMDKWTNDFFDSHPGANLTDWSKARYQFWVDNGCTESIAAYNKVREGKGDPATIKTVDEAIQGVLDKKSQ